jgi:hypothetical protein
MSPALSVHPVTIVVDSPQKGELARQVPVGHVRLQVLNLCTRGVSKLSRGCHGDRSEAEWSHLLFSAVETKGGSTSLAMTPDIYGYTYWGIVLDSSPPAVIFPI